MKAPLMQFSLFHIVSLRKKHDSSSVFKESLAVVTAATTSVDVGCEAVLVSALFFLSSGAGAEAALAALTSDLSLKRFVQTTFQCDQSQSVGALKDH